MDIDQQYQYSDNEFERMSGEDLQELSEQEDRARRDRKFVKNAYNDFMVLYFQLGYSFKEADKKAKKAVDEILGDAKESEEEIEANRMGHPLDT